MAGQSVTVYGAMFTHVTGSDDAAGSKKAVRGIKLHKSFTRIPNGINSRTYMPLTIIAGSRYRHSVKRIEMWTRKR